MGLDEETLGVLMEKLKIQDRARFLRLVDGYTFWERILQYSGGWNYLRQFCKYVLLQMAAVC